MSIEIDEYPKVGSIHVYRFDEVSESMGYSYRGCDYVVELGDYACKLRAYDDESGTVIIREISPPSHGHAVRHHKAKTIVDFIVTHLAVERVKFYCPPTGGYRLVNLETLAFVDLDPE